MRDDGTGSRTGQQRIKKGGSAQARAHASWEGEKDGQGAAERDGERGRGSRTEGYKEKSEMRED